MGWRLAHVAARALVAAWALATPSAAERAPSCESGAEILGGMPTQTTACEAVTLASSAPRGACCGDLGPASECRTVEIDGAFCPPDAPAQRCSPRQSTLMLGLRFVPAENSERCCAECQCWGDPYCTDFAGTRDEWVICDSRNSGTCKQQRTRCNRRTRDHNGEACEFVRASQRPGVSGQPWRSWEEDGSPCQSVSLWTGDESRPRPEMLMYSRDGESIHLIMGERGIISSARFQAATGDNYTLDAGVCLADVAESAWTASLVSSRRGSGVPESWSVSRLSDFEVRWTLTDSNARVFINVTCVRLDERARLDVTVRDTRDTPRDADAAGFCVSGVIQERVDAEARGQKNSLSFAHSSHCLREEIGECASACKAFITQDCHPDYNLARNVRQWCSTTDFGSLANPLTPDECLALILPSANVESCDSVAWADLICTLDAALLGSEQHYEICLTLIADFGFLQYREERLALDLSPQLPLSAVRASACGASVAEYTTKPSECARGVSLEYLYQGLWREAIFLPEDFPPCNGTLEIPGSEYPELVRYPVRLAQCDTLEAGCQSANMCLPTSGFEAEVAFAETGCPTTPAPTPAPSRGLGTIGPSPLPTAAPIAQCQERRLDIGWVIDSSNSIGQSGTRVLQELLPRLTDAFSLAQNLTRFAGIQFAQQIEGTNGRPSAKHPIATVDPKSAASPFGFASDQATNVLGAWNAFASAIDPALYTNTPQALQGMNYIMSLAADEGGPRSPSEARRVVIIVTDGLPSQRWGTDCGDLGSVSYGRRDLRNTVDVEDLACTEYQVVRSINEHNAYVIVVQVGDDFNEGFLAECINQAEPSVGQAPSIQLVRATFENLQDTVDNIIAATCRIGEAANIPARVGFPVMVQTCVEDMAGTTSRVSASAWSRSGREVVREVTRNVSGNI